MATRPRPDIYVNLPALEKLDDMLIVRSKILLTVLQDGFEP
uniref:PRONE domain-containing protein n=1 Tax=Arundo donax TaxID=35708 RepID=A0A0A9GPU3_ARUDO